MKRSIWLVLFVFSFGVFMAGCSCFPGLQCAQETPPPQHEVYTPPPPPPAPAHQPPPPPKQDRN